MKAFPLTVCVCLCVCVCVQFKRARQRVGVCQRYISEMLGDQITAFLSTRGSDSCAAAVCASVRKCVCQEWKGCSVCICVCVCVCVCVREWKIEKQRCNLCCTSDPTALGCLRLCWGLLTWEKKKEKAAHQTSASTRERERERKRGKRWEYKTRVEREEAVWFKMFVFTCTFTTAWR